MKTKEVFLVPPTYCDVNYAINPWMGQKPNKQILHKQWEALVDTHRELFGKQQVHVLEAAPGHPELCFCGDSVFLVNNKAIFGNFLHEERAGERDVMNKLLKPFGFEEFQLPPQVPYEGSGETLVAGNKILVGHGVRSSQKAAHHLQAISCLDVIDLALADERFFHIDTALLPLRSNQLMIYDKAFAQGELSKLADFDKVFVNQDIATNWGLNSIIHNDNIIVHKEAKNFIKLAEDLSFDPILLDMSEFLKLGGGAKCLTLQHHVI